MIPDMTMAIADVETGLDLKILRMRHGVTQTELARQMGVWRQTLSVTEGALRPNRQQVARYLAALDEIVRDRARSRATGRPAVSAEPR